jgi:hypothetical protein
MGHHVDAVERGNRGEAYQSSHLFSRRFPRNFFPIYPKAQRILPQGFRIVDFDADPYQFRIMSLLL